MDHDQRTRAVLDVLAEDDGTVQTKDAFMVLGEVAGCILAFVPEEHRDLYVTTLGEHVRGVAAMRDATLKVQ